MPTNHILSVKQFADKNLLNKIFERAAEIEKSLLAGKTEKRLEGKILATLFFEPSTRTRLSFEAAALRLGGQVISVENAKESSSNVKGESLEDTIKMFNAYADIIVLRHYEAGTAERAAKVSNVPIINAGDGGNEHPTQALLDLYTMWKELGRLENLKVAFGFDPLHSRTIRSLSRLLSIYPKNSFTFISPKSLEPDQELISELKQNGAEVKILSDMEKIGENDVIYTNRLQQERFKDKNEFEQQRKMFVLKASHLNGSRAIVLDPLPRIDEIDLRVDDLPNAKYFSQAKNGLYVRAALLLYTQNLI